MKSLLTSLALILVLVPEGRAQTFSTGDYQINRKKSSAGFEVAELLAGSNITLTWDDATKTATIAGSAGSTGTVTSFAFTNSTGITGGGPMESAASGSSTAKCSESLGCSADPGSRGGTAHS